MTSLFERLGGADAVSAAVDIFYDRVLADSSLSGFFTGTNMMKMRAHQRTMLTAAFGGPNLYQGRDLVQAHAGLIAQGLGDVHYDAVVGHLADTLAQLGVADELITEAAQVAESVRGSVLGRA